MNVYSACAVFVAGAATAALTAFWWDHAHPQPRRIDLSPERPQVLKGTYGHSR